MVVVCALVLLLDAVSLLVVLSCERFAPYLKKCLRV